MKLNLGCGNRKIHGFINIDASSECDPDIVCDIRKISEKYSNIELIYACHVLEHFPFKPNCFQNITWKQVVEDWYKALKIGGVLRIAVPDFESACKRYLQTSNLDEIIHLLYGGQKYDFDFHYNCWDFASLKRDLLEIGFKEVKKYDWKKTEHFYVDDYSQSYLPHMDKNNGSLMSLNIEAIK
jgi:predicted SAM-dependent methyltransferase